MKYTHGGYYADGSLVVYGRSDQGVKVALFRGYLRENSNQVTLYPQKVFIPTKESVEKKTISIFKIEKEKT